MDSRRLADPPFICEEESTNYMWVEHSIICLHVLGSKAEMDWFFQG
jgi:hypothetical protein